MRGGRLSNLGLSRSPDLAVVAVLAVVALLTGLLPPGAGLLHTVAALLLVTVLPGYALVAALEAGRGDVPLEWPARLLFTIATSMSVVILTSLVLNALPWGLTGGSWRFVTGAITLGAMLYAAARRTGQVAAPQRAPAALPALREAVLYGSAAVVVGLALGLSGLGTSVPSQPFTQLWALPAGTPGGDALRVGVLNMESRPLTYRVVVLVEDRPVTEQDGIRLQAGETWDTELSLPPGTAGQTLRVLLYRGDQPEVYRQARVMSQGGG